MSGSGSSAAGQARGRGRFRPGQPLKVRLSETKGPGLASLSSREAMIDPPSEPRVPRVRKCALRVRQGRRV
eukprot:11176943-Lingulodinium_polyedra.AAC.1